jgi:hypothetical protein
MPYSVSVSDSKKIYVPGTPLGLGKFRVSIDAPSEGGGGGGGEFLGDGTYSVLPGPLTCGSFAINGSTSGNTLNTVASSQLNFGTGSFTVEWWQYQSGENNPFVRPFSFGSYPSATFAVSYEGSNFFGWFPSATPVASIAPYKNQWVHFAITRLNGVIKVFKNGQQIGGDIANTSNISHSTGLTIGNEDTATIGAQFGGYITNFHIMKASKYLTNFTPDTSKPIPPTSQTVFLLSCDDAGNVSKDYVNLIATSAYGNTWNSINPFGF